MRHGPSRAASLLLSFLALSPSLGHADPAAIFPPIEEPEYSGPGRGEGAAGGGELDLSLRHIFHHGTSLYPGQLKRLDVEASDLVITEEGAEPQHPPVYRVSAQTKPISRLHDRSRSTVESFLLAQRYGYVSTFAEDAFTRDEVPQPNITDKATVLSLAKIAADAYNEVEHAGDWLDAGKPYNYSSDFGWKSDGLRGHVFTTEDNSTVIIGMKGTSLSLFNEGTVTSDKFNDNLLFSCCCARVSMLWSTVCDCYGGSAYTCNNTCVGGAIQAESSYYRAALQLYYNVTEIYPNANVWVVGHSLGGSVSSLLGQTFGLPVVTFQAPPEALASSRLGLPAPPGARRQNSDIGVYHFGHTADPLFLGACNGATSACNIAGYAMETQCHAGMECIYDVVTDKGWRMGLGNHRIQLVIKDVIEVYEELPVCSFNDECEDCWNWNDVNDLPSTNSTSKPATSTATTTCHSPGWWGCRDPTTTPSSNSTVPSMTLPVTTTREPSTSHTSTTTCLTPGRVYGCWDDATSTPGSNSTSAPMTSPATSTLKPSTSHTSTNTCLTPGRVYGCWDDTTSTAASTTKPQSTDASSTTCLTPGRIYGCWDGSTSTASTATSSPTLAPSDTSEEIEALLGDEL